MCVGNIKEKEAKKTERETNIWKTDKEEIDSEIKVSVCEREL